MAKPAAEPPAGAPCPTEAPAALEAARAQVQATATRPLADQRRSPARAAAMTTVTAGYAAELDTPTPPQRMASLCRIRVLPAWSASAS